METLVGNNVEHAAALLKAGELVAIPTETVYGLAGNALSADAVGKIYEAKNRPRFNPLILHVPSVDALEKYAYVNALEARLAAAFMPGSLTLLLRKKDIVPDLVTAGSAKVALRVPNHGLTHALLALLDFPLAAPSANPSGHISPVTAAHVIQGLGGKIGYVLDGGPCEAGLESSIVEAKEDHLILHRKGTITKEQLEAAVGLPVVEAVTGKTVETAGQLKSHYAPQNKPLFLGRYEHLADFLLHDIIVGVITLEPRLTLVKKHWNYPLTKDGNLATAAANLFQIMHELDNDVNIDCIVAEEVPNEGIGRAINDRLSRAHHNDLSIEKRLFVPGCW